jgi:hypothetical protein
MLDEKKKGTLKQEQEAKLPELMFQALTYYSITKTMLDVAEDQKDFGNEEGQSAPIAAATIGSFAGAYGSAAGAVLQYLESLTVEEAARDAGVDKATQQNRFAANDENYLIAYRAVRLAEGVTGQKAEADLLRLAAGSMAFLKGASLVNKYYSLGGHPRCRRHVDARQPQGAVDAAGSGPSARSGSRGEGEGPLRLRAGRRPPRLPARSRQAEGDDEEKLAALEAFWESAFWCELAASTPGPRK